MVDILERYTKFVISKLYKRKIISLRIKKKYNKLSMFNVARIDVVKDKVIQLYIID